MKQLLLIGLGGFIGSIARYLVSKLNFTWQFHHIPMGTLLVNIIGSLLIGFIAGILVHQTTANENLRLFLITGICGGFTTFSAFAFENLQLLQDGYYSAAVLYIILSLAIGVAAVLGGILLSKLIL